MTITITQETAILIFIHLALVFMVIVAHKAIKCFKEDRVKQEEKAKKEKEEGK